MRKIDIVRAWKDTAYRTSLSAAEQASLPANPAGSMSDDDLMLITGGAQAARPTHAFFTLGCCTYTRDIFCSRD